MSLQRDNIQAFDARLDYHYPLVCLATRVVTSGLMIGAALVYPILENEPNVYRHVLLLFFGVSCVLFNLLQLSRIIKYGHISVVITVLLLILATIFGKSYSECVPWIPVNVMIVSLLTFHMPKLHRLLGHYVGCSYREPARNEEEIAFLAAYHMDYPAVQAARPAYSEGPPSHTHILDPDLEDTRASVEDWRRSLRPPARHTRPAVADVYSMAPPGSTRTPSPRVPDSVTSHPDGHGSVTSQETPVASEIILLSENGRVPSELSSIVVPFFAGEPSFPDSLRRTGRRNDILRLQSKAHVDSGASQSSRGATVPSEASDQS